MLQKTLLVAHIVVLGYWLGADLVINSTYRYVSWSHGMPFAERSRLMDHVMHVDQHVRYALVLQLALGISLAALNGYLPFGGIMVRRKIYSSIRDYFFSSGDCFLFSYSGKCQRI